MNNKNIIITGSTNGIGLALAKKLISKNNKIFIVGRSANYENISKYLEIKNFEIIKSDLSEVSGIKHLLNELKKLKSVDLLINNVGSIFFKKELNNDKIDKTFFLNHLSYFIITIKLLDKLENSYFPKILNVTSKVHSYYDLDLNDLENNNEYNYWKSYCKSKLLNIYFTYEFIKEYKKINCNCIHPGFINSNFGYKNDSLSRKLIKLVKIVFGQSTEQGAAKLHKVLNDDKINGKYFNGNNISNSSNISYDINISKAVWEKSLSYLNRFDL